jgi:hypothetical protein
MTTPNRQVRRATVEDLQTLGAHWEQEGLPRRELEPRFKEFQLVEGEDGELLAALGFAIVGTEGCLHSETFAHPEQADELRSLLWERTQLQARNHGLVRIWTQLHSPFWHSNGLQYAGEELLAKLPPAWAACPGPWLCLQIRDDLPSEISIDKEFKLFRETQREQTERVFRQARVLKMIAGVICLILFVLVLVWAAFFLKVRFGSGGL